MTVRTRMAPSPTGEYHVGHLRTLLYNYAFAKQKGGEFILRIEDTDRSRHLKGAAEKILNVIKDYGLSWNEGPDVGGPHAPYVQSQRLDIYKEYADKLLKSGHAYYCFCSEEYLTTLREAQVKQGIPTKYDKSCLDLAEDEKQKMVDEGEKYVIRLNVPDNEKIEFNDMVYGKIEFDSAEIDDQVLLKSDGFPTYHLAVVVDDYLMGITHVLRGNDWLPSTPKHVLLYKAFGWELPVYVHLPNLKENDGTKKLSKRYGSVSAEEFLKEGYLPEAVLNFLMFLGWNPGTEKEIYSLSEFINGFSLEKINKTDLVCFDRDKLAWYNGQYIRSLSEKELFERIKRWSKKYKVDLKMLGNEEKILRVVNLVQERLKVIGEFKELTSYFFESPKVDRKLLVEFAGDRSNEILDSFYKLFAGVNKGDWNENYLDKTSHELIKSSGYTPKEAFMTLRIAVSGVKATPPIFNTLELIGQKEVLSRLRNYPK